MAGWFNHRPENARGMLALPTSSGKRFTAVRFLCQYPLYQGYKILCLAHTHQLLEQAFFTFGPKYKKSDTVNAVNVAANETTTVNAVTTTEKSVGMQKTGLPIAGLILAMLAVCVGFLVPKRK